MASAMNALLTLAVLLSGVLAAPNLNYPLMDQQPPVARVDQTFIFSLLPSTFNSTAGTISYTTSDMPSWLSFNSGSAAFYGLPTASDEGQQNVTITASDTDGTTESWFNLIVTSYTSPAVHQGFNTQISNDSVGELASVQRLPGGSGITVNPYWSFSLGFLYETFRLSRTEPINGNLFFSARERGTTTLPSWLSFNNNTMTFGGVAPAEGTFTIVATGSDFWGYTGAQTSFVIQVGTGEGIEVDRMSNFSDIVTRAGDDVDYPVDISDILIGGEPATADQVTLSLDSGEFPWLSIDSSNRITGKTPDRFVNGTITPLAVPLTVVSTNASNTLELVAYLGLGILPYPFTTLEFPNVTATPGSSFEFDLSPYVRENSSPPNTTVLAATTVPINTTVFPTEAAEWLTFHEGNLTLQGNAPQNPDYDHVEVEFTAGQSGNVATSTLTIDMDGVTNSPPTGGTTSMPSTTGKDSSGGGGGLSMGARIAIGVVFGVLGLILLLLLLWFCCRRRRKNKEADQKAMDDGDSFVVGSPGQDPFRKSHNADPPRNLLGEFAKFSGFHIRSPSADGPRSPEMQEKPNRLDGLRGIFGWGEQANVKKEEEVPPPNSSHGSFFGQGDVISVRDPMDRPSQSASSFDQTFGSSSSSRASWESRESFQWSSVENDDSNEGPNNRLSTTASIPRPRQDFTPRYPRNNSPSRLANLASQHTLNSPEFSEFHGSSNDDSLTHTLQSSSGSSGPSSGFTGANRFDSAGGFRSIDEEDEGGDTDAEGPAVVSMAERQSFETRTPRPAENVTNRMSHSNFAALGPALGQPGYRQSVADSAFDDADTTEVHGLGYPASSIFGSPGSDATRGVSMISSNPRNSYDPRASTIRAIPEHEVALSPPLPQVGSFAREITRPQPHMMHRPKSMTSDGRVIACANETFSMHPTINPPPRIALSAATWSSNPPSSYRAEVEGGGSLPTWLHFDARELELWGVPALANAGDVTTVKITEIMPRDKRRSDPSQFGYEPAQERVVGRVIVEVVDRLKSPQFALENSPHAF